MNSAFSQGEIINNYRLERLIGIGGFGEVWLAEHTDLSSRVAIKIPTLLEYVKQLRAEGRIQYDLEHPNIVRIHDLNTSSDPPYCVMEFVDGENLRERLDREVQIPLNEALRIMQKILLALHESHSRGIVHRDLKPENILLSMDGEIKITDFGLGVVGEEVTRSILFSTDTSQRPSAFSAASSSDDMPLSASIQRSDSLGPEQNRMLAGTYDYMSPEQRTGRNVDARSDIFGVGVILFEMLAGERPGTMMEQTLRATNAPEYVQDAVMTALDEYEYRHSSAAEFLRNLHMDNALNAPARKSSGQSELDQFLSLIDLRFQTIEGGAFLMGSHSGPENERPQHQVAVQPFQMGIYPVTTGEFCHFLNAVGDPKGDCIRMTRQSTFETVGSRFQPKAGCENHPVNCVSWTGALAFCQWLSELTGQAFNLPTEAQWEFCARSGDAQREYPWGNSVNIDDETAVFGKMWSSPQATLSPVDTFAQIGRAHV